jgi:colanic acid/amylovoran biosynthesis glycosyltransferase
VATFREKKGHIYTLKAFHSALNNCPGMSLTLVGNGEAMIQKALFDYITLHQLQDKVKIIHEIDFNELHPFLSGFDVFIHPSCYSESRDCEGGAPVVLLDAQACGLPVIATTHCDIPDEVADKKTGLLTPEKDVAALANSIYTFYKMQADEFSRFSLSARKHVEDNYSIANNAKTLQETYFELIQKSSDQKA